MGLFRSYFKRVTMPKPTTKAEKKSAFLEKLTGYLNDYGKILLVDADNVTSLQMAQVRQNLRGKAAFLMGKNTMIRRALKGVKTTNPAVVTILGKIVGNLGMIFTNEPLDDIVEIVESNKKQSVARSGAIAPCDVIVPKGSTGMDPTQTAFFQALNIASTVLTCSRSRRRTSSSTSCKESARLPPSRSVLATSASPHCRTSSVTASRTFLPSPWRLTTRSRWPTSSRRVLRLRLPLARLRLLVVPRLLRRPKLRNRSRRTKMTTWVCPSSIKFQLDFRASIRSPCSKP